MCCVRCVGYIYYLTMILPLAHDYHGLGCCLTNLQNRLGSIIAKLTYDLQSSASISTFHRLIQRDLVPKFGQPTIFRPCLPNHTWSISQTKPGPQRLLNREYRKQLILRQILSVDQSTLTYVYFFWLAPNGYLLPGLAKVGSDADWRCMFCGYTANILQLTQPTHDYSASTGNGENTHLNPYLFVSRHTDTRARIFWNWKGSTGRNVKSPIHLISSSSASEI